MSEFKNPRHVTSRHVTLRCNLRNYIFDVNNRVLHFFLLFNLKFIFLLYFPSFFFSLFCLYLGPVWDFCTRVSRPECGRHCVPFSLRLLFIGFFFFLFFYHLFSIFLPSPSPSLFVSLSLSLLMKLYRRNKFRFCSFNPVSTREHTKETRRVGANVVVV